jgi:hypothetical protein
VLVQPATVVRWRREGLHRCWSRRSGRRAGRPRIDSEVQALIRRMAAENRLWGGRRIHGELLKLGIAVSERTVSRYLADIRRAPSQTWRTFLANHFGQLACTSRVMLWDASDEDDGVDVCGVLPRRAWVSGERLCVSDQWSDVHWPPSFQRTPVDGRIGQAHVPHRRCEHPSSGRDPPNAQAFAFIRTHLGGCLRPQFHYAFDVSNSSGRARTLETSGTCDPLRSITSSASSEPATSAAKRTFG